MWSSTFLDETGKPAFNLLQNLGSAKTQIVYYIFDVLVLNGRDIMAEPLATRRALLRDCVLPQLNEPVRECAVLEASLAELVAAVGAQGLEGLVAKRLDSRYEPGQRSGAWQKMPVNRSQEFVIGGYTPSARNFDALIFGYYDGDRLLYAGRTRSGFTPESREKLFKSFWGMESATCAGWRIRICGMDAGWAPPASGLHSRAGWKAGGVATR